MNSSKHFISVNQEKCIGCNRCVIDCPESNIYIGNDKRAKIKSQSCMKCGHCIAICPVSAVTISGFIEPPKELDGMKAIDAEALLDSIMRRRSIRQFKNDPVEEEKISKIIEAGRWSPTGRNSQCVKYIILDKEKQKAEELAVNVFNRLLKILNCFSKTYRDFIIGEDFFFKRAPIVIVIAANNKVDGALAASNMALMAEAQGLGVLYSGFFTIAAKLSHRIRDLLGVKRKELVTTLVIGYPAVKYKRTAQRDVAKVTKK